MHADASNTTDRVAMAFRLLAVRLAAHHGVDLIRNGLLALTAPSRSGRYRTSTPLVPHLAFALLLALGGPTAASSPPPAAVSASRCFSACRSRFASCFFQYCVYWSELDDWPGASSCPHEGGSSRR